MSAAALALVAAAAVTWTLALMFEAATEHPGCREDRILRAIIGQPYLLAKRLSRLRPGLAARRPKGGKHRA